MGFGSLREGGNIDVVDENDFGGGGWGVFYVDGVEEGGEVIVFWEFEKEIVGVYLRLGGDGFKGSVDIVGDVGNGIFFSGLEVNDYYVEVLFVFVELLW